MREASLLLGSLQSDASFSYSGITLFGFSKEPLTRADDLAAAWVVWQDFDGGDLRNTLVPLVISADLVFIFVYSLLLIRLFAWLKIRSKWGRIWVLSLAGSDLLENIATAGLLLDGSRQFTFSVLPWLTLLKWTMVIIVLIALGISALWRAAKIPGWGEDTLIDRSLDVTGRHSGLVGNIAQNVADQSDELKESRARPWSRLRAQIILLVVFTMLMLAPLGGPVDQFPEVLRLEAESKGALLKSGILLGGLVISLLVSGVYAALLDKAGTAKPAPLARSAPTSSRQILGAALVWAVAVTLLRTKEEFASCDDCAWWSAFDRSLGLYAGPLVLVTICVLAMRIREPTLDAATRTRQDLVDVPSTRDAVRIWQWASGISIAAAVVALLAMYRALLTPTLVEGDSNLVLGVVLLIGAALAAPLFALPVIRSWFAPAGFAGRDDTRALARLTMLVRRARRRFATEGLFVWVVAVCAATAALAFAPLEFAPEVGVTGVLTISLSALAFGLSFLNRHGEFRKPWKPLQHIAPRLRRTPYLTLLAITAVVASMLDTGGYFDVERAGTADFSHTSLTTAFDDWSALESDCVSNTRPLILVAAPGGGIRAAMWTALVLDKVSETCPENVFAVSAVSGGSLGTVAWAWPDAGSDRSAEDRVREIAGADSLATSMAGLFFRDLPHALVPLQTIFDDRNALMERTMNRGMGFGVGGRPVRFSELVGPNPVDSAENAVWEPVLILNGTSARDGCRVVTSNTGELATEADSGAAPCPSAGQGPLTAAIDSRAAGVDIGASGDPCTETAEMEMPLDFDAISSVMLSARFPLVSPSGTLRRCVDLPAIEDERRVEEVAVVDGGYSENSGLLTLLQVWEEIEPQVLEYNEDHQVDIAPIFVLADNHYLSAPSRPKTGRLRETGIPLSALRLGSTSWKTPALVQLACREVNSLNEGACDPSTGSGVTVLSPNSSPQVAAPLGWVLSDASLDALSERLSESWEASTSTALRTAVTPPSAAPD